MSSVPLCSAYNCKNRARPAFKYNCHRYPLCDRLVVYKSWLQVVGGRGRTTNPDRFYDLIITYLGSCINQKL